MNTTTTTIELRGCPTCEGPAQAIAEGEGVRYRHVDLRQATNTRGVSEAMVAELIAAGDFLAMNGTDGMVRRWERAKAALSAEPAAQGDADLAGYVDPEQVADMQRNGGGVSIGSFSERYGRTVPVYFRPAPPAQPSERVPDPETACAMWIKPDTTEAESNAFLAGARAMLAAIPAAPAKEGDGYTPPKPCTCLTVGQRNYCADRDKCSVVTTQDGSP